jgi:hypothetical protein
MTPRDLARCGALVLLTGALAGAVALPAAAAPTRDATTSGPPTPVSCEDGPFAFPSRSVAPQYGPIATCDAGRKFK